MAAPPEVDIPVTEHSEAPAPEAWASKAREGHYGSAPGTSLAADDNRIRLPPDYGHQSHPHVEGTGPHGPQPSPGLAGRYQGKTMLVTGGTQGIGEGCVRVFFAAGSNVVFCSRSYDEGRPLMEELNSLGQSNRVFFVKADVSIVDDLRNLTEETVKAFGRIDCLINNAGWHPPPKTIDDFSVAECQDLMQLNFISYYALCKFALPHIRKVRGNIINISSWVGIYGQAMAPTYAATKGATTAFSKALAIDEAAHGVRVNVVSPGNIWTPLWKAWSDGETDPQAAREAGDRVQIMGRKGTIEETGRLCLCIAADLTFTTGVDHVQSGGAELGYGFKS
eukprot:TRINITY_DN1816_c1_g1_i1.p1 TRINITY_DN1816_c1_g1~~TRINITY_DN1816_c1_g1_i1.p1  ORF type:complete len:359 (+),score=88.22 TRINITY_DN1816_c1_g1_i1:72-1079(+)